MSNELNIHMEKKYKPVVIRDDHGSNVQDRNMGTVTYKVVPDSHQSKIKN